MHNLTKIKLFRTLLYITYPICWVLFMPVVLLKKKKPGSLFFFLDRYAMGGAQRVHLDILNSVADIQKQVYFTRLSLDDKFKDQFYSVPNTDCEDIHIWCDYLLLRLFSVHYFSFYVNRHKDAQVFSSNSTYFYDMLPFLKKNIRKTELLHAFTFGINGMEYFGLGNYKYLDHRAVIDRNTANNIKKQYEEYNIPAEYLERVTMIENAVPIPEKQLDKKYDLPVRVLFAGRGGPEKRIYLINRMAEYCIEHNKPVKFHFVGTMEDQLSDTVKQNSVMHGSVNTQKAMYEIYEQCDVLIITSWFEGFSMVVKEAMVNKGIPLVTALDGFKIHLKHLENALLIDDPQNEEHVVKKGLELILFLTENPEERKRLSLAAYNYGVAHFDIKVFAEKYHAFFDERKSFPVF